MFCDPLSSGAEGPIPVVLSAEEFQMGSDPEVDPMTRDSEKPQHPVVFSEQFAIGRYPLSFSEYKLFGNSTGHPLPDDEGLGRDGMPAIHISWNDATQYCHWLSEQTGRKYRLPTGS